MDHRGCIDDANQLACTSLGYPRVTLLGQRLADLVHAEKAGKSVIYHLKLSVLEEALLGFVHSFGAGEAPEARQETSK